MNFKIGGPGERMPEPLITAFGLVKQAAAQVRGLPGWVAVVGGWPVWRGASVSLPLATWLSSRSCPCFSAQLVCTSASARQGMSGRQCEPGLT